MGCAHHPHPFAACRSAACPRGVDDSSRPATQFVDTATTATPRCAGLAMVRTLRPNDLWQIDGTQVALADESLVWIIDILDDHARYAIGATATRRFPVLAAWRAMETAIAEHGAPRQLISDNGLQFISRDGHNPVHFQQRLAAMGIKQLKSRPRHPQPAASSSVITAPSRTSTPTRARDHPRGAASPLRSLPLALQPRTATPEPQRSAARREIRGAAQSHRW